jgi:hypothetical protein
MAGLGSTVASAWSKCVAAVHRPGPAALLLYLVVALVVLSPLASEALPDTPAQDLANHVSAMIEAGNALAEGQFPIRVAPNAVGGQRYPFFQFYCNTPYTLGGALYYYLHVDPYLAWKTVVFASLVFGAFFVYRCSRFLTQRAEPSILAGVLFMTAPYMLTDLHARLAFPELVSFNLLPGIFFYAMQSFSTARPGNVLLGALLWYCLATTHAIYIFYGSFFLALYFLLSVRWERRCFWGLLRVGASYGLGLSLAVWYLLPQAILARDLVVADYTRTSVHGCACLTPLGVLLSPTLVLPRPLPLLDNPRFGLQLGWPILGSLLLLGLLYRSAPGHLTGPWRGSLFPLGLLFGIAFFMVWTPFDFWSYLPPIFSFVLYPYRLLVFCVLYGSLLAAHALTLVWERGAGPEHFVAVLLLTAAFACPYLTPPYSCSGQVSVEKEIAAPNIGRGGGETVFLMSPRVLSQNTEQDALPCVEVRRATVSGRTATCRLTCPGPCRAQLPVLYYPQVLEVRDNGRVVPYGNRDRFVALQLSPGKHTIHVRYVGIVAATRVSLLAWGGILLALLVTGLFSWRRLLPVRRGAGAPAREAVKCAA